MNVSDRLKSQLSQLSDPGFEDLFSMIAAACSQCCGEHSGGNKTCPPPPKLEQAT